MGFNLEVPLEICEYGMGSATTARDSTYQRINLDPANYDGATYYFEVVAVNTYASSAYTVYLRHGTTDKATVSVPASTSARTRIRSSSFTPTSGNQTYFVRLPVTNAANNVIVYEARIVVVQSNATKTRIQIPLLNRNYSDYAAYNAQYVDNRNVASDGQSVSRYFPIWKYDAKYFSDVPASGFAFETCCASNNAAATASISLYNKTDNAIVATVTRASTTPAVVATTWSAGASNWHDGDEYHVQHKISNATYYSRPGNAYIYITLNPITSYQVLWKISRGRTAGTGALINEYQRAQINPNNYDNESIYLEATGYCADNGNRLHLQDDGTNESGTGGANVSNADINFNSGTKARVRSTTPLSLDNGDRFILDIDSSTNNLELAQANLIINGPLPLTGTINGITSVTGNMNGGYHNLLPLNVSNGSESGTVTGLVSYYGGGSLTSNNTYADSGSRSINLNNAGVPGGWRLNDASLVPAVVGMDYVVSFKARNPVDTVYIAIIWYNSSKGELSYSNTNFTATSTFTKREITATAPANTAYVGIYGDVGATSNDNQFDELMIETGTTSTTWTEGWPETVIQALSGAINGVSSVTGDIRKAVSLNGIIEGVSSVTGNLPVSRPLSGTINGSGVVSGALGLIQQLTGTIQGTSTLTGDIRKAVSLTGAVNGLSTITGDIRKAVSLTGVVNGLSTVTGDIRKATSLNGLIEGNSTVTGILGRLIPLTGAIDSISTVTGDVRKSVSLTGAVNSASNITGNLNRWLPLSGTINGIPNITGDIRKAVGLTGTISGLSTVTGDIRKAVSLTGLIESTSTITGSLATAGQIVLTGAITAASTVTGALSVAKALTGTIEGTTSITGNIGVWKTLTGLIEGNSTITGDIRKAISLTGVISGTSTVTGTLGDLFTYLTGSINATSNITGILRRLVYRDNITAEITITTPTTTVTLSNPLTGATTTTPTVNSQTNTPMVDLTTKTPYTVGTTTIT